LSEAGFTQSGVNGGGEAGTTVGSYFVSNYPPFSFWQPERAGEALAALGRVPADGQHLGIYVHIPFCRKRCHFCYFRVYTDKDSAQIKAYVDGVAREMALYAKLPFIGNRKPGFIYFGGGTPSYLSSDQLSKLVESLQACLSWDQVEEVTFECEPGTLTEHKLKVIRELGVTRLSLGIEHFDDHVLEVNGRAHHSKEILRAWDFAKGLGFPQINVDLIAGMLEETDEKWRQTVAKTLALQPDSVTIYQMEVPYNTTIYKEMKAAGKLHAPVADWTVKRRWVQYAFNEFENAGYTVASAYTVVKNKAKTRFVYRDRLWAGADLIGLGVSSFSHAGGTHFQNLDGFGPYLQSVEAGRLPINRALTPSPREQLIREMILQLKLGRVSTEYFRRKFGADILTEFAKPLKALSEAGLFTIHEDEICVTRGGLLQIDRLLHEFFLPEHRGARHT
jgi:oxygen-independent coproporphyrinogen-3 oxidase